MASTQFFFHRSSCGIRLSKTCRPHELILSALDALPLEPPTARHDGTIRRQLSGHKTRIDPSELLVALHARVLKRQLAALNTALEAREQTISEQQVRIEDPGQRLNVALAQRVQELARYRSEFFGRLQEVLGDIPEVEISGDRFRFRFQSELFFSTGSADMGRKGREKLDQVAETIKEGAKRIPADVDWVLMVEGHTDVRPIRSERFPSNWELSTARGQSIVYSLARRGEPAERLASAGFCPYHPLVAESNAEAWACNCRIEMRLTNAP